MRDVLSVCRVEDMMNATETTTHIRLDLTGPGAQCSCELGHNHMATEHPVVVDRHFGRVPGDIIVEARTHSREFIVDRVEYRNGLVGSVTYTGQLGYWVRLVSHPHLEPVWIGANYFETN